LKGDGGDDGDKGIKKRKNEISSLFIFFLHPLISNFPLISPKKTLAI
jgi:hypothetical protein